MGLLTISGLIAGYSGAEQILKGLDFVIEPGEIVCIIGPNGAGKSTLLKTIAGLLTPSAGTIAFRGEAIAGLPPPELARRGVAYVPQEANVFPSMTIRENLEIGGYVEPSKVAQRMGEVMERFPVLGRKRRQAARTLSGGERQLLAMGMALMVAPVLMLLDEPTAGLSPLAAHTLFQDIRSIMAGSDLAVALVEQNVNEALAIGDRAYVLVDGRTSANGAARDMADDPEIKRLFLGG